MMTRPIKIIIADDHEIVLDGLKAILNPGTSGPEQPDGLLPVGINYDKHPFQIIGVAKSGEDLMDRMEVIRNADVLVLDYSMTGMNGIEAAVLAKKAHPHIKVVLFSMYESDALIKDAFACNIEGYVTKGEGRQRLLDVIKRVYKGEKMYPQIKNPSVSIPGAAKAKSKDLPLSKREREIVCEIVQGATTEEIAQKLQIAFNTVEVHRSNIYRKLGINKMTDLVKIALEHDLCGG